MVAIIAFAGSALLLYLGTGPTPVPAMTWLALLPVLLLALRRPAAVAAFAAGAVGTAHSWAYFLGSDSIPVAVVPVIVVCAGSLAALTVAVFRSLRDRLLLGAFAAAATWTGALYLVSLVSPVGVMGALATAQADVPLVTQVAAVTGMWGVEFLLVLVPAGIAAVAAGGARTGIAVALVALAAVGYGAARLAEPARPGTRVAVVARSDNTWATPISGPAGQEIQQSYVDQVRGLPGDVRLVVLPEAVFTLEMTQLGTALAPLRQAAEGTGAEVVVGALVHDAGRKYNTVIALPADGGVPVVYRKRHVGDSPGITPGEELALLPGGIALQNCMDINFPEPSREYALAGARTMAIPADDEDVDGWQHSRTAVLRGVEHGFAVAWAATDGRTIVADDRGRVLAESSTGTRPFAVAVAEVPAGSGPTAFSRLGAWFAWLCLVMAVVGAGYRLRRRDRPVVSPTLGAWAKTSRGGAGDRRW
ncbi:nitrilase-related carbon-nitrogen hydrolase [Amycolatopsis lurida]